LLSWLDKRKLYARKIQRFYRTRIMRRVSRDICLGLRYLAVRVRFDLIKIEKAQTVIASWYKGHTCRRELRKNKKIDTKKLTKLVKSIKLHLKQSRAVLKIQTAWRCAVMYQQYECLRSLCSEMQSRVRTVITQCWWSRIRQAALRVQRWYRGRRRLWDDLKHADTRTLTAVFSTIREHTIRQRYWTFNAIRVLSDSPVDIYRPEEWVDQDESTCFLTFPALTLITGLKMRWVVV
jgi:hypothetical protein